MNAPTSTAELWAAIAHHYDNAFLARELGRAIDKLDAADGWRRVLEAEAAKRNVSPIAPKDSGVAAVIEQGNQPNPVNALGVSAL